MTSLVSLKDLTAKNLSRLVQYRISSVLFLLGGSGGSHGEPLPQDKGGRRVLENAKGIKPGMRLRKIGQLKEGEREMWTKGRMKTEAWFW